MIFLGKRFSACFWHSSPSLHDGGDYLIDAFLQISVIGYRSDHSYTTCFLCVDAVLYELACVDKQTSAYTFLKTMLFKVSDPMADIHKISSHFLIDPLSWATIFISSSVGDNRTPKPRIFDVCFA
jgi:hypothetical protein